MSGALRRNQLATIWKLVSEAIVIADDSKELLVAALLQEALEATEEKLKTPGPLG